jgi:radical SAM superfamily enzyme YgiQ (UPF0313 family)
MEHLISSEPLGLGYIASSLEKNGYDVKIEEMSLVTSEKEIENRIKMHHPDVVGVSCFTNFRYGAFRTLEIAKEVDPDIITLAGGSHATLMSDQVMKTQDKINFIVLGEGECTTVELLQTLEKNGDVKKVKGICFKKNKEIIYTEPRPLIEDLDILPFPARHLMDLSLYSDIGRDNYFKTIRGSEFHGEKISKFKKSFIMGSRGCPFSCQFCSISKFWCHRWRGRSPENVVDEMEYLSERFNIKVIGFNDDTFSVSIDRVIGICKEIIKRGLDIKWFSTTRADRVSIEMLEWMKKSGCFMIAYSPESGSQKILDNINKRITVKDIIKFHELCHKVELPVGIGLMVGNVGETNETIEETIKLLDVIRPEGVGVNLTTVYPATGLYELAKKQGFINDDDWLNPKFLAPIYTVENSMEQLMKWKQKIMMHYYLKIFGFKRVMNYCIENMEDVPKVLNYWLKRTFGKRHQIM